MEKKMKKRNIFYAQSGGPTAVINATACGIIEAARKNRRFGKVYACRNGIVGALEEDIIDTGLESPKDIAALKHTPASAFGSCRYKLKDLETGRAQYDRLLEVFAAHDIGYFFYNGGGDSQDTTLKVSKLCETLGYPLTCIGIPKTIDNDLVATDTCPGYGSVAKYIAISTKEAALDVASMCKTSTKVFILEVMGRHTGWLAAASGLANSHKNEAPHIILFPEIPFQQNQFLERVTSSVKKFGFCVIVASEGIKHHDGRFLSESGLTDAFGHKQLGGVALVLAQLIKSALGLKYHWAVSDYLQRSARHIASETDLNQAYAAGQHAVTLASNGDTAVMTTIVRKTGKKYRWTVGSVPLDKVANHEKTVPRNFITSDGFGITPKCRRYILPLIQGEAYPPYSEGIPQYVRLKNKSVKKKLKPFTMMK